MLDRLFGARVHDFLHLLGLIGIAAGMPLGKAFMSMAMLLLIANFLLEAKFKTAIKRISDNRLLLAICIFFLLLIIGLSWSNDVSVGIKELKSRLPFLAIPLIIGSREPISRKHLGLVFHFFLASLLFTSAYNFLSYQGIIGNYKYDDVRGMSLFGSHIRYGIIVALGVAVCIKQQVTTKKFQVVYTLIALWFILYTYFSEILTGAVSMIMVFAATFIYLIWLWKRSVAIVSTLIIISAVVYFIVHFLNFKIYKADIPSLPVFTANGVMYYHSNEAFSEINGQPLYTYYCEEELIKEWKKVSKLDFLGYDNNDHLVRNTFVRYMTAMELPKDSVGFQQLSKSDISNIEDGYTYPEEKTDHVFSRINGVRYQLINHENPNGHSLLQRFEYWKASIHVIKKHWLIGVGTGGNQKVMDQAYKELNSKLLPENRCKSHNMFMSYFISYGVVGFLAFATLIVLILYYSVHYRYLLGVLFIAVIGTSFLIEDTLETQLGVTIFGFFTALIVNEMNLKGSLKENS